MLIGQSKEKMLRCETVHSLPGRLRLRAEGLSVLQAELPDIAARLAALPSVRTVRVCAVTEGILLGYDSGLATADELRASAQLVLARYVKTIQRVTHDRKEAEEGEAMTTTRLTRRSLLNGGAFLLGKTIFPGAPFAGVLGKFTSLSALTALGLTAPMGRNALRGLREEHRPNADFLTVTSIVASLLVGNAGSALMILAMSDVAELMTTYTIEKTRSSIKQMLSVDDSDVWKLLESGVLRHCPISEIEQGDQVVIHTGEKIAVDGSIVSGAAVIDQSAITGEFVPAEKREGDEVFAGAVLKSGVITVKAAKVGDQTVVSRIVKMVEQSETKKAPIQRYADRFSNYLVPLNYLLCAAVWLATKNPQKALKMLVIDYSCGIKLSTATAFSAAINTAVRRGVLIKGGAFLEQMSTANTVLLDKTGTVTEGKPRVVSMKLLTRDMDEQEALAYAMAAEETSTHPLASAILTYGRGMGAQIPTHGETITAVSRGSRTEVDGHVVRVGNLKYMQENQVRYSGKLPESEGAIANYVALDDCMLCVLFAMDKPRENVRRAINSLRTDGVGDIELLTGDMEPQARAVAAEIGADGFKAQLLPEQKAEAVLKLQTGGNTVVMVGDGINDAPALAYADVGVSLGSKSTDIAIETSDVVIGQDDPMMIPELRRLSRRTMRIVEQNFAMAIGINTVGLILGAASGISVWMSALLHNASTILVVANSLRLMLPTGESR